MDTRSGLTVAGVLPLAILGYFLVHALLNRSGEVPKTTIDITAASEETAVAPAPLAIPALPAREPVPPPRVPVQAPANEGALPGQVLGIVYDAEGNPAQGVTVAVTSIPKDGEKDGERDAGSFTAQGKSGADGQFAIAGLGFGMHAVGAFREGFYDDIRIILSAHAPVAHVVFVLKPVHAIAGTVVAPDGTPVAEARVYPAVRNDAPAPQRDVFGLVSATDAEGAFSCYLPREGSWQLLVLAEGFAPTLSEAIHTGTHDVRIRLVAGQVVSGRVVDDATNATVPGARVQLVFDGLETPPTIVTADGAGSFTFAGVAPGDYRIEVFAEGYVLPDAPVPVQVGNQPLTKLELRLIGDAVIRGVMYVAETGEPLAGGEVSARRGAPNPLARRVVTGDDGTFEFGGLSSGTYTLTPGRLPGFSIYNRIDPDVTVQLEAGEVVEGVAVAATQGLTATGRVLDAQGNPVAGAEVRARGAGWQDEQTSDAEGRFVLANLQAGTAIHVSAVLGSQWSGIQGPFTVGDTGLHDFELVLSETQDGLLAGVLVDADDNPLQASLAAWPAGGPIVAVPPADTSDAEGRFVMPQVAAGAYRITAKPGEGEQMEVGQVTLTAGEQRRDLRLVYPGVPKLAIAGRIVLPDGAGVATSLRIMRQEGVALLPLGFGRSGSDGAFRFENLVPGTYALDVQAAPGAQGTVIRDLAAGMEDLYVELEPALRLEGYVLDATGAPVAEYDIVIEELTPLPGGSSLQRLGVQRISHPQGYFGFDANQGAYAITVQVEGRDPQRIEVELISSSEPGPLEIVLP